MARQGGALLLSHIIDSFGHRTKPYDVVMAKKRLLIAPVFLISATLCLGASTENDSEKLKLALEIKGLHFNSKSQHELYFNQHEHIKSLSNDPNNEFFVELTPKRLSEQKLGDTSSFLVEINISRREGRKQVTIAKPLVSVEYGGETKVQQKTGDGNEDLEVSVLSLR